MSRAIKFRMWDNNAKKWLSEGEKLEDKFIWSFIPELSLKSTMSGVLEQYTGLKDKNGKEIYEGDILKIGGQLAEVIFDDDKGSYMGEFKINYGGTTIRDRDYFHDFKESREIVGNIHENPELLGGEE